VTAALGEAYKLGKEDNLGIRAEVSPFSEEERFVEGSLGTEGGARIVG
jgi:hypothetical protein